MRIALGWIGGLGLAGLVLACCFPFDRMGHEPAQPITETPPRPAPSFAPGTIGTCVGDFQVVVGTAVSPTSPYLAERMHPGEQLPTGYNAAAFSRVDGAPFVPCRVSIGLYVYRGASRTIVLEDPADLGSSDAIYMKSWHMPNDGDFEVVISDDVTRAVLASQRFTVASRPVAQPSPYAPCTGTFDTVIGPAAAPDSPYLAEHLHPGEHLPVDGYVALELRPHGIGHFPNCRMRFGYYHYAEDGRRIVVESERDMTEAEGTFNKAWNMQLAGNFEIAITDVATGARLATEPFTVE